MEPSQKTWDSEPLQAVNESETQMAKFVIQDAKVNFFRRETFPELHLAVMRDSPEMVSALLPNANVDLVHETGITALGMACINDHGNILFVILLCEILNFSIAFEKHMMLPVLELTRS